LGILVQQLEEDKMAITYLWDVSHVETYPTVDSNADVIHKVDWTLTATDGVNNDSTGIPVSSQTGGQTVIDTSDLSDFVAFDSITIADVQAWVDADLGADMIAELKVGLDTRIAAVVTPTTVSKIIGA